MLVFLLIFWFVFRVLVLLILYSIVLILLLPIFATLSVCGCRYVAWSKFYVESSLLHHIFMHNNANPSQIFNGMYEFNSSRAQSEFFCHIWVKNSRFNWVCYKILYFLFLFHLCHSEKCKMVTCISEFTKWWA